MNGTMRPKIRDLQPITYDNGGSPALMLRDPLQLHHQMLLIPEAIGPLLYLCDGSRDLDTISLILKHHFGLAVDTDELHGILQVFDDACLLDNQHAWDAQAAALSAYRSAGHRQPASAGASYPADPAELHRLLQDHLEAADVEIPAGTLRGILSPHIDFERGAATYSRAWKQAADSLAGIDLVVIIGTDHHGGENALTLTRQHYATPFGVLRTDVELVDALAAAIGSEAAFRGELFHRSEHSLELPLVWLHHLIGDRDVPVVPVLCGALDQSAGLVRKAVESLRRLTAGRRVFTVISGDLAHVGPAFGGAALDPDGMAAVRGSDEALLGALRSADADTFLAQILENGNANNICGAYPLYLALQAFAFEQGLVSGYEQCPADQEGTSIVSIAGMVFL